MSFELIDKSIFCSVCKGLCYGYEIDSRHRMAFCNYCLNIEVVEYDLDALNSMYGHQATSMKILGIPMCLANLTRQNEPQPYNITNILTAVYIKELEALDIVYLASRKTNERATRRFWGIPYCDLRAPVDLLF